jgi:hypothetical protein
MSYLLGPRLHFAGRFRADVSTVNNLVTHFGNPDDPPEPGWNPGGSGSWRIASCTVTSAVLADGTVVQTAADDPVIGLSLAQNAPARLVDLDPEQQMVSQIWGMRLQLGRTAGSLAFKGVFKTAAFSDIWFNRARIPGGGDFKATASYQSVLTDVAWDDLLGSRFLLELKEASEPGFLSIKFNVDGFDQTARIGRIVGSIGPARAGEPAHFIVGRHCMGDQRGPVWYFPAVVDTQRSKLIADFGNALQTTSFRGPFDSTLDLQIGSLTADGRFSSFGRVPIGAAGWYEQTAGVCEFPPDRPLAAGEMAQLGATPIGVVQQTATGATLVAAEGADGLHVRAEELVYRMSSDGTATVTLRASRFGQPLPNADIAVSFDHSWLQQGEGDPTVGVPPQGLTFPASVTTDAQGTVLLPLTAHSIDNPRGYIDGQVYGVRYGHAQSNPQAGGYFNPADFISILLWTDYRIPSTPTWWQDVQLILKQYQQLYPVMEGIVDLGDYDSVVANKPGLQAVFSFPEEDPRYMPVTRDLSPAKRQMILYWLLTTGNAGQPNLGIPPADRRDVAIVSTPPPLGGKTTARQRIRPGGRQPRTFVNRPI